MNKDLIAIFEYLEREKGIKREIVINAIEESFAQLPEKASQGPPMSPSRSIPKPAISKCIAKKRSSMK